MASDDKGPPLRSAIFGWQRANGRAVISSVLQHTHTHALIITHAASLRCRAKCSNTTRTHTPPPGWRRLGFLGQCNPRSAPAGKKKPEIWSLVPPPQKLEPLFALFVVRLAGSPMMLLVLMLYSEHGDASNDARQSLPLFFFA